MPNSELIKNVDGSVYHLNIDHTYISEYIITVGDPERVYIVAKMCDAILKESKKREFVTVVARLGKKQVTIISTGIGTDNIDIVFTELHILFMDMQSSFDTPPFERLTFIRLGTSGSICEDISVDAIVVNSGAIGLDLLMHYYKRKTQMYQRELEELAHVLSLPLVPYYISGSKALLNTFLQLLDSHSGITLTACGFYGPQGRDVLNVGKHVLFFEKISASLIGNEMITNIEMETSGIYGMSELFGHRAISINVILANRITKNFSKNPKKATSDMIESSLEVIRNL